MKRAFAFILWCSVGAAILLAFAWPGLVSLDPANRNFEVLGKATLAAFFVALAAVLALKLLRIGKR